MALMMENLHFAKGIDPVADAFASTVRSDVYSMRGHGRGLFVIYAGVGATGTSTITVNACDDVVPSNRTAIPSSHMTSTRTRRESRDRACDRRAPSPDCAAPGRRSAARSRGPR